MGTGDVGWPGAGTCTQSGGGMAASRGLHLGTALGPAVGSSSSALPHAVPCGVCTWGPAVTADIQAVKFVRKLRNKSIHVALWTLQ